MATVNVTLAAQVPGGPTINVTREIVVEAYDKIDISIDADGQPKKIEIQPTDPTRISFLLITSDLYSGNNIKLTYGTDKPDKIELDQPHFYLGSGVVSLLGTDLKTLEFQNTSVPNTSASKSDNKTTTTANLQILVGRHPIVLPQAKS